jgi:serine/threonine protein kinase
MLKENTKIKGRYLLLKILGKGGFSEVWLAEDTWTSTRVALKFYAPGTGLDDEGIQLFIHEFALLSDLNHNNLLKPSHFDIYEKMPFLELTYCENGSALRLINQMDEKRAWQFLRDVSEGLHYLHSNTPAIIHQDIKPDNILIDRNGRFVITDFGISTRARNTLRRNVTSVTTGGTLAYMSPERFGHDPSPILASDVWSLGATMFELLTGTLPFGEHGGLLQKKGADIPHLKGNYSDQLKTIVYQSLAETPWERPTALHISDFARKMLEGIPLPPPPASPTLFSPPSFPPPPPSSLSPSPSPHAGRLAVLIAALSFAALIAVAFFVMNRKGGISDASNRKERIGQYDKCIHQGDSLTAVGQKEDTDFELKYVDALERYRMALQTAENLDDSPLRDEARRKIGEVEQLISKTYEKFMDKAKKMEEYDALEAAKAFAERAGYLKKNLSEKRR